MHDHQFRSQTASFASRSIARQAVVAVLLAAGFLISSDAATAERLDELSLERWGKLREVERYQLNIAEKYYREKNYKVAAAEYEKFLALYETSDPTAIR